MNDMLGPPAVKQLRASLSEAGGQTAWPALTAAEDRLEPLALRARAGLLAEALTEDLGTGYGQMAAVFRAALVDDNFTGWMFWPVGEAAVTAALQNGSQETFDDALALLAELTPRMSSEFAIRRLLIQDLDRALGIIHGWTTHPNEHVRRLASEGTRPYLPWAIRVPAIVARPDSTLPILDALHRDGSETVRRSVANHLNDISRHAPDAVVETAIRWKDDGEEHSAWVVRHGLRTLVKKAHPGALAALGFSSASVSASAPVLDQTVNKAISAYKELKGQALRTYDTASIDAELEATGGQAFIDYTITNEDVAGQYVASIPADYSEKAKLERMAFTSVTEALAERFHMDENYLKSLNPGINFDRPGSIVKVANTGSNVTTKVAKILADKANKQVRGYDASGKLVVVYPSTIGSSDTPSPTGLHAVSRIAFNPNYTYNPKLNFKQGQNDKVLTIPPGPNGPVGSVWIALDKPTYGIHGTPDPSKIGKTESHGCVRLTNWDATELAKIVSAGVTVDFVQ